MTSPLAYHRLHQDGVTTRFSNVEGSILPQFALQKIAYAITETIFHVSCSLLSNVVPLDVHRGYFFRCLPGNVSLDGYQKQVLQMIVIFAMQDMLCWLCPLVLFNLKHNNLSLIVEGL